MWTRFCSALMLLSTHCFSIYQQHINILSPQTCRYQNIPSNSCGKSKAAEKPARMCHVLAPKRHKTIHFDGFYQFQERCSHHIRCGIVMQRDKSKQTCEKMSMCASVCRFVFSCCKCLLCFTYRDQATKYAKKEAAKNILYLGDQTNSLSSELFCNMCEIIHFRRFAPSFQLLQIFIFLALMLSERVAVDFSNLNKTAQFFLFWKPSM